MRGAPARRRAATMPHTRRTERVTWRTASGGSRNTVELSLTTRRLAWLIESTGLGPIRHIDLRDHRGGSPGQRVALARLSTKELTGRPLGSGCPPPLWAVSPV